MADEFGFVRRFFLGGNKKLGCTHGNSLLVLSQGADFTGKYARSQSGLVENRRVQWAWLSSGFQPLFQVSNGMMTAGWPLS
jgi:hypothetical protein